MFIYINVLLSKIRYHLSLKTKELRDIAYFFRTESHNMYVIDVKVNNPTDSEAITIKHNSKDIKVTVIHTLRYAGYGDYKITGVLFDDNDNEYLGRILYILVYLPYKKKCIREYKLYILDQYKRKNNI